MQFLDTDLLAETFNKDDFEMTTIQAKDIYVTWDGDQTTWTDYTRKVRLQYEKTEVHKRKHLAPELASRLTGCAWTVTAELDYNKLSSKSGVKYLLEYLRSRLCQTAVPDAGARLEELLIKLRRPPSMGFAQWSATLLETNGLWSELALAPSRRNRRQRRSRWSGRPHQSHSLSQPRQAVRMADAHTGALQPDHLRMDELKVLKNVDKTIKPLKLTNLTMMQFPKKILTNKVNNKVGLRGTTDGRQTNGVNG